MAKVPKVNRQQQHQANECTFLGWLRTSITLIGFEFAIARFCWFLCSQGMGYPLPPSPVSPNAPIHP